MDLNSSLVHFKKAAEYLSNNTAHVFIAVMLFPPFSFDFRTFLILDEEEFSQRNKKAVRKVREVQMTCSI